MLFKRLGPVVGAAVVLYVALTMAFPHSIPRLAVLPKPPTRHWNDGCNEGVDGWQRRGIFWEELYEGTTVACMPAEESNRPILGRSSAPFQRGYGEVMPSWIHNGGDPTGIVEDVHWQSWGEDRAIGSGFAYYQAPNKIVAESTRERATVVAFNLGTCRGVPSYNAIQWFFPQQGDEFDPRRWFIDTCTGQRRAYN